MFSRANVSAPAGKRQTHGCRKGVTRRRDGDLKFPKVGKRIRTRKQVDAAKDRAESEKVKQRSEGRCEVVSPYLNIVTGEVVLARCPRRAEHVMHLIGGRGKRGRGISALKEHKLHGCVEHHKEIDGDLGGKKLRRIGGPIPLWTDPYERVKARREVEA